MTEIPRVLVLVRHAEAVSFSPGGDAQRALTESGREVAREVGARLAGEGVRPDLLICSPAVRTVQTYEELRSGGLQVQELWGEPSLYDAAVEDVVDSIREVPEDIRTLVVLGHAPGVPGVIAVVADHREQDEEPVHRRVEGWPPAGVGVVVHAGPWSTFPDDSSAVVMLQSPPEKV
ncbi:SixA phosphatase family protein [Austwickia chelonae]|uniref:SixA phosphatase family protein n=1 Tax=Austwickia chelonae TaxID=100225 RepID=UPI0013C37338|nr:histidine phosphatase family protein [Austwickia chelonae]